MIKVLMVEDEPLVRRGIASMMPFERFGMTLVGEASSGEEALEALKRLQADVLLADISMPGMSGLELLAIVRERYPRVLPVMLTCHQDFHYLQQAMRLGAVDYMVKTQLDDDSVQELLGRVARRLQEQQGEPAVGAVGTGIHGDDIAAAWETLSWLVDDRRYGQMLDDTARALPAAVWRGKLEESLQLWLDKCPSLEQARPASGWPAGSSVSELAEEAEAFRTAARRLLRGTMYSEEVIRSVIRAVDLLHERPGERLSQADVCKAVTMSVGYFSKCFKEITGQSYVAAAQRMSLREAEQLLRNTNEPVYRIAELSGFEDEKYFGKIFRLKTGLTPGEYRLRSRNEIKAQEDE
ncbi:response regulator [Cohnella sp. GbtcB17]|uniref:response regulator transcription factor n=1 Tax=Cohnella sp. GbtcB17 TaxID=2824762 RepID=UPI001C2F2B07|nr:response regulator [Cohnella sp. GbtcB17]